ncbi:AAA family ATPase [bacterium]|nr:AAA family ATPase [bacterium]
MKQEKALEILKSGHNILLTGPAGTGKTYILNEFIEYFRGKGSNIAITASTGIAATHINGRTIHSWAGLGIKQDLTQADLRKIVSNPAVRSRIKNADVLIIDEISMLHDFQLDMVDLIYRAIRHDDRPLGGVQLILCGDFFQLPPVDKGRSSGDFITKSEVWGRLNLKICYLTKQHRQSDNSLNDLLLSIRLGDVSQDHINSLKNRLNADLKQKEEVTKLFTHNINVDTINLNKLKSLEEEEHIYKAKGEGKKALVDVLIKNCLAPEELILKRNAIVMFVKNDFAKGYVNGTIGKVIGFDDDGYPIVRTRNGKRIVATPTDWAVEENNSILATITQVPLRLAWAITVHKSQGMTLDAAEIDLSRAFTFGLGYVALSRVRSLENLTLLGINNLALKVSEEAKQIDADLQMLSKEAEKEDYEEMTFRKNYQEDSTLAKRIRAGLDTAFKQSKKKAKPKKK